MAFAERPINPNDLISRADSQVKEQFASLSAALENLESRLDYLGNRLEPVLRSAGPSVSSLEKEAELVPLASRVREMKRRVDCSADLICGWLDRIEL